MARTEEESSSVAALAVGCVVLVVIVFGGGFFFLRGTSTSGPVMAPSAMPAPVVPTVKGTEYTKFPDGSMAQFEVQLDVTGRSVIRRGYWNEAGILDEVRSGLFVDTVRSRPLTAEESKALAEMSKVPSLEVSDKLPTVLLADG